MNKITPIQDDNSANQLIKPTIKTRDHPLLTADPLRVCRICLEEQMANIEHLQQFNDHQLYEMELIVPCECSGSMGYVHQKCIRTWIQKQISEFQQKKAYCQICKCPIFFNMKKTSQCDCRLKNITNISCCNIISSFIEVILLLIVIVVFKYSEDLQSNSMLKYTLITLIGILTLSFSLTIMVMISEAFIKKTRSIGRIYSIQQSQEMGLREPRKKSVKNILIPRKKHRKRHFNREIIVQSAFNNSQNTSQ